ncbi:MAG: hypothetical protein AB7G93_21665 [Bdellovibrionales bacterium]
MSGKYSGAMTFVFVMAIAFAAMRSESLHTTRSARGPSAHTSKKLPLDTHSTPFLKHTHKLRGPIQAVIELIGTRPERAGDVFTLRGLIRSAEGLSDVDFKWSIPAGLEVINGQLEGRISVPGSDEAAKLEITLKKLVDENLQVHLIAGTNHGGARIADSAQYNTELQELINASKKELLESSKREAQRSHHQLKVFH